MTQSFKFAMKIIAVILVLAGVVSVAPNMAIAQSCYTSEEAAAQRVMRLQSELLVIGLSCQESVSSNLLSKELDEVISSDDDALEEIEIRRERDRARAFSQRRAQALQERLLGKRTGPGENRAGNIGGSSVNEFPQDYIFPLDYGSYEKYQLFTRQNAVLLQKYEEDLINYYRRQGVKNPEEKFSDMRTGLANGLAALAVKIRPDVFCHRYQSRLDIANDMNWDEIKHWASRNFASAPLLKKQCLER